MSWFMDLLRNGVLRNDERVYDGEKIDYTNGQVIIEIRESDLASVCIIRDCYSLEGVFFSLYWRCASCKWIDSQWWCCMYFFSLLTRDIRSQEPLSNRSVTLPW